MNRFSPWPAGARPHRRLVVIALLSVPLSEAFAAESRVPSIEIWKDPSCGCCHEWVRHLEAGGFSTITHDTGNVAARARLGMPRHLGSCHTASVAGFAIEGHVPASEIRRLLDERPDALGLAVPGMPIGSPGMDGQEYGSRRDAYQVLLVGLSGAVTVFRTYPAGGAGS